MHLKTKGNKLKNKNGKKAISGGGGRQGPFVETLLRVHISYFLFT